MANKNSGYDGVNTPVVIFFGQSAGGKTTALVRLIRFLSKKYRPEVSEIFHNYYYGHRDDVSFYDIKEEVETQINALSYGDIMGTKERALVNIIRKEGSEYQCRFLEVPGEDFIDLHNAGHIGVGGVDKRYDYLEDAMNCPYKKIWVFFFDADFASNPELMKSTYDYIGAIKDITIGLGDKIIVLINKIDKIKIGEAKSPLTKDKYEDFINDNFNNILKERPFSTPQWDWFGLRDPFKRHYELLGYSSFHQEITKKVGSEPELENLESNDDYPQELWNTIDRAIKNRY